MPSQNISIETTVLDRLIKVKKTLEKEAKELNPEAKISYTEVIKQILDKGRYPK